MRYDAPPQRCDETDSIPTKCPRVASIAEPHLPQALILNPAEKDSSSWASAGAFVSRFEAIAVASAIRSSRRLKYPGTRSRSMADPVIDVHFAPQFVESEQRSSQWAFPELTFKLGALQFQRIFRLAPLAFVEAITAL
jgi:hypothetical protein